jgi:hypothetical protein
MRQPVAPPVQSNQRLNSSIRIGPISFPRNYRPVRDQAPGSRLGDTATLVSRAARPCVRSAALTSPPGGSLMVTFQVCKRPSKSDSGRACRRTTLYPATVCLSNCAIPPMRLHRKLDEPRRDWRYRHPAKHISSQWPANATGHHRSTRKALSSLWSSDCRSCSCTTSREPRHPLRRCVRGRRQRMAYTTTRVQELSRRPERESAREPSSLHRGTAPDAEVTLGRPRWRIQPLRAHRI